MKMQSVPQWIQQRILGILLSIAALVLTSLPEGLAELIHRKLLTTLGEKWLVYAIGVIILATAYLGLGLLIEKNKNKVLKIPKGFRFDDSSGICFMDKDNSRVCPSCLLSGKISQLADEGDFGDKWGNRWRCQNRKCNSIYYEK